MFLDHEAIACDSSHWLAGWHCRFRVGYYFGLTILNYLIQTAGYCHLQCALGFVCVGLLAVRNSSNFICGQY